MSLVEQNLMNLMSIMGIMDGGVDYGYRDEYGQRIRCYSYAEQMKHGEDGKELYYGPFDDIMGIRTTLPEPIDAEVEESVFG